MCNSHAGISLLHDPAQQRLEVVMESRLEFLRVLRMISQVDVWLVKVRWQAEDLQQTLVLPAVLPLVVSHTPAQGAWREVLEDLGVHRCGAQEILPPRHRQEPRVVATSHGAPCNVYK